jgi:hypothetical protein
MTETQLKQAVRLNKELEEVNADINALDRQHGQGRTHICWTAECDAKSERELGQGRKFFNESRVKTAALDALKKEKARIEEAIAAI